MKKDIDFCHLGEIYPTYTEKFIGYCYKSRTRCFKNCFQKEAHQATEEPGTFIRNRIADKIVKSRSMIKIQKMFKK